MSRSTPVRSAGWVVGAAVGLVAGAVVSISVQDRQERREASEMERLAEAVGQVERVPPPGDAVRALVEQDTHVALDPLLADLIPADDVKRAEEILVGSPVPARIAFLSRPDLSEVGYTTSGAAAQWRTSVGEEGHYVVLFDNGYTESGAVGLEDPSVDTRTKGQPGPALVRLAEEMATWEAEPLSTEPYQPSDFDYWGGIGGGLAAGGLMGVFGVVPVFLLLRWFVGTRRRKVT